VQTLPLQYLPALEGFDGSIVHRIQPGEIDIDGHISRCGDRDVRCTTLHGCQRSADSQFKVVTVESLGYEAGQNPWSSMRSHCRGP